MASGKRQKQAKKAMLDALSVVGIVGKEADRVAEGILARERIERKLRSDAAFARKLCRMVNGGTKQYSRGE